MNKQLQNQIKRAMARVEILESRASSPQAFDTARDGEKIKTFFERALNSMEPAQGEQVGQKAYELAQDARRGVPKAMRQLNEIRVETVSNYIRAEGHFLSMFFDPVNLEPGDVPYFQNTSLNEVNVNYMSEDGRAEIYSAVKSQSQVAVPLKVIESDQVEYATRDIYQGFIGQAAQATFDIGYDLTQKIDGEVFSLMDSSAFGAFDITNAAKEKRTYVAHSKINAANLPTTNELAAASNGASTKFRLDVVRKIMRYATQWANVFGSSVMPTGVILVPSLAAADLADEITPDGSTNNSVADELMRDFIQFDYLGVRWVLVPDATLAPKLVYPVFNRPIGRIYYKPSMDEDMVRESPNDPHRERRWQNKVIGTVIPAPWTPFCARVRYQTA